MPTNKITYSKNVFVFLDIMGFKRIIDESTRDPELIGKIANMLRLSKETAVLSQKAKLTILQVDPSQYIFRSFSDTSIISGPYTSHDALSFLFTWIMYYQYLLWKEQQAFLRGAIVFGDIYYDEGIIFGPALIDAYCLENSEDKAVWPRVLVGESVLSKATQAEIKRDFFEFLKRDEQNLVYLDYLRELFHIIVLGENKRLTGQREQDFGLPIELFENHKTAILTQMDNLSKEENEDDRQGIVNKYLELSRYHNSTIDTLRQVINDILRDQHIVRELFDDQLKSAFSKDRGVVYTPRFSAEDHPEQADMLNILGTALNRVIETHLTDDSTLAEAIDSICREAPIELTKLEQSLAKSRIDLQRLLEWSQ